MNLSSVLDAFQAALQLDLREGLSVTPHVTDNQLQVQVRHQDTDALRGFDVVAEPLSSEQRNAEEVGGAVAEVVARELAYGQLPAVDDAGQFKRIVV